LLKCSSDSDLQIGRYTSFWHSVRLYAKPPERTMLGSEMQEHCED
jgi:hypothetical protein